VLLDDGIVNRQHWRGLASLGATFRKTGDGGERLEGRRRDEFTARRPFEDSDDLRPDHIDVAPAPPKIDHDLLQGDKGERPKRDRLLIAVVSAKQLRRRLDVRQFRGRSAVLDVIALGKLFVGREHDGDGNCVGVVAAMRQATSSGEPFGNEPVAGQSGGRSVLAEIKLLAVQRDIKPAAVAMLAETWKSVQRHGA